MGLPVHSEDIISLDRALDLNFWEIVRLMVSSGGDKEEGREQLELMGW